MARIIIITLILLCLPFSMSMGQDCPGIYGWGVSISADTAREPLVYQSCYLREKHRADSLEEKLKKHQQPDALNFFIETCDLLEDSITALNKRLEECMDRPDSVNISIIDYDGETYWRDKYDSLLSECDTIPDGRDSVHYPQPQWQGYWRIDNESIQWIPNTTWRPVPKEGR